MLPGELTAASFGSYPPRARELATREVALLRRLPLAFLPLLLRELIVYDWKFPSERSELERQFTWLNGLSADRFTTALAPFARLKLTGKLEQTDWVGNPARFSEQLSAQLWSTHQIDAFSAAAVDYIGAVSAAMPDTAPSVHRLGIASIGQGVAGGAEYRVFRKLRPHGTYFSQVKPAGSANVLLEAAAARARAHPAAYGHWYIDGGSAVPAPAELTCVSYGALASQRAIIQGRMQKTYESAVFDPEAFRTMLAQMRPEDAGFGAAEDPLLARFQLSLLTEASGTQVFATTFVQWAAREALRRAQPLTLFLRFAPRQRDRQMNELLAEQQRQPELDPQGSLVDADMGAYYTWLNQRRLAGSEKAAFLAWFENHGEAVAIGSGFAPGSTSTAPVDLAELAARVA